MSDDLVKRLREVKDWWREPGRTAEQAADRIEKLEKALDELLTYQVASEAAARNVRELAKIMQKHRAALEGKDE